MRDGTAKFISRNQIFRRERGQGKMHFPCPADHEQEWQPYSYAVDPSLAIYGHMRTDTSAVDLGGLRFTDNQLFITLPAGSAVKYFRGEAWGLCGLFGRNIFITRVMFSDGLRCSTPTTVIVFCCFGVNGNTAHHGGRVSAQEIVLKKGVE